MRYLIHKGNQTQSQISIYRNVQKWRKKKTRTFYKDKQDISQGNTLGYIILEYYIRIYSQMIFFILLQKFILFYLYQSI